MGSATTLRRPDAHYHSAPETALTTVDSKLLHMWEAKQSLLKRWKRQRFNRKLRLRIAKLDLQIQEYATQLACQQWGQVCESMHDNLDNKRTWQLLRHLLDPTTSRTHHNHSINKLLHAHKNNLNGFFDDLRHKHLPPAQKYDMPKYTGEPNDLLSAAITEAEVRHALATLRTMSAPGPDLINNKILRNLDDNSVTAITAYFNHCFDTGTLPSSWKDARVIFIPKPNKPLNTSNLRPISLTSCLGKTLEHVILNRLSKYMEDNNLYPSEMVGFRKSLSCQDIMLRMKHDIITPNSSLDTQAILSLDLHGAFNNVSHSAILRELNLIGVGGKTYDYICTFLSNRTATIHIGTEQSLSYALGSYGTPQGSVLSPFLFNLSMMPMAQALRSIPDLKFSLYADDITLWTTGGSDGEIQDTLQAAADAVVAHAGAMNLTCSPQKSELLLLPSHRGAENTCLA